VLLVPSGSVMIRQPQPSSVAVKPYAAIPESIAKEWISVAYVQAIAAQVGLNISEIRWDDGVDLKIGSTKPVTPDFDWQNLWICLQLKATSNWDVEDGKIKYFLKQHNYDVLRKKSISRQYLVLYTMPQDRSRARWFCHRDEHSELVGKAYFLDLLDAEGVKPRKNGRPRSGRTVTVSTANRLTATTLHNLYGSAATWTKQRLGL